MTEALHTSFVAAVGDAYPIAPDALARLADALRERFGEAQAAFPEIALSGAELAAWLADRVPDDGDPAAGLAKLRVPDLFLACACARGIDGAAEAFERVVMPAVPKAIARVDSDRAFVDEVVSNVRVKLLVGEGDRPPRVDRYLGQGPLTAFAQVVALREAQSLKRQSLQRRGVREQPLDDELLELPIEEGDPELAQLKAEIQGPFRRAFREALAELSPRDRNVLRLYLIEDVGSETLARMYGVHRATIARWIADARGAVLKGTRRRLMKELALGRVSFDSLMGKLATKLDVSLASFLGG